MNKKDIRLQVFVTSKMDDQLDDLCAIMGMHKNEIVRVAIANYISMWGQSANMVKDMIINGYTLQDLEELVKREKRKK